MKADRLEGYVDRVYAFAVRRTYTREEADELSQAILLTAVENLPRLRDEDRFEPWLWGLAANAARSFRREKGRQRAMFAYDAPFLPTPAPPDPEEEELHIRLRASVARLSRNYRELVLLRYYDGLSIPEIAGKTGLPEGTVTWRLSQARKKLKKECVHMHESALRPVSLRLDIYGTGNYDGIRWPFPSQLIDDALSQSILWHCYEQPRDAEELTELCGVPAYYIEEALKRLTDRAALVSPTKGRYQTDFIIWEDKHSAYLHSAARQTLRPLAEELLSALNALANDAAALPFYRAGKRESDLFYLYSILAFVAEGERYNPVPYPPIPRAWDGYTWRYIASAETVAPWRNIGEMKCVGARYSHLTYSGFAGLPNRAMMYDNCVNACAALITTGHCADKDSVAQAVEGGYVERRETGEFHVAVPALNLAQQSALNQLAHQHLSPLMPAYTDAVSKIAAGYSRLFPRHLADDVDRMCHRLFVILLRDVVAFGLEQGRLTPPSPGYVCDVLLEHT